jgi:hypothetical protein
MYGWGAAPGETVLDRDVVKRRCLWCPRRVKPQPAMWPGLVSRSHNANHARIRRDVIQLIMRPRPAGPGR